eukprot:scaffold131161_cov25-Attheya_sp.AAC.1
MMTELGQERDEMHFELVLGVSIAAGDRIAVLASGAKRWRKDALAGKGCFHEKLLTPLFFFYGRGPV